MKLSEVNSNGTVKLLIYGESGSGKTVAATSFPTPLLVYDFDGKINSAARTHSVERTRGIEVCDCQHGGRNQSKFQDFDRYLTELERMYRSLTGNPEGAQFKTVVVDSITQFCEALMTHIITKFPARRVNNLLPNQQDYHQFSVEFKDYVMRLLSLPINVVMTAHIEESKDENTGEIEHKPFVKGQKLAPWLPAVFEEVYHQFVKVENGKSSYVWRTQSDAKFNCRSQLPGMAAIVKADWESINQALIGLNKGGK
jgi:hypothetical protein